MGPHLPSENHFSKKVSSASRTKVLTFEVEISSKNEVDEYLEIGPQLDSNSGMDFSKNSECNAVSDSSSKCTSVPHSVQNGPSVASSTYEEPWEVSLMNIERKFRGLDQDIGEESPDSTVRKGDTLSENSVPCQTSNDRYGVRGVVEYDNFTDEEEEMSSSNISSSKQESVINRPMFSSYKTTRDRDNEVQRNYESNKSEISQSEAQRNLPKRKFFSKTDEYKDSSFKKSKQKDRVDINNLFNNHGNSGKYGFGFSRQEQLNLECDLFCSTSGQNQSSSSKGSGDYKAISFVKSDHVFDLSTLNKNISNDNSSQSRPKESELLKDSDNENIYAPGPSGLNGVKECTDSKESSTNDSGFVQNDDSLSKENDNIINSLKSNHRSNIKPSLLEKKENSSGQKDVSSSRVNYNFYEMDIEEIDKLLNEALETKKAENAASKPSISSNEKKSESDASISQKSSIESAKSESSSGSLSDDIIALSSILIEKLTFLVTNNTLSSLSSLLIQLQTRLMDWKSGSLESRYFMSRLQEVQQYLQQYELNAVSGDWTCQWHRKRKRYFYFNKRSRQSLWCNPEESYGLLDPWDPWESEREDIRTHPSISKFHMLGK